MPEARTDDGRSGTRSGAAAPYRWVVLANVAVTHAVALGVVWLAIPALAPVVSDDLGVSTTAALLPYAVINLVLLVGQVPAGVLGDRYPLRWVVGGGVLLAGVGTALRAVVPTFIGLLLTSLLTGAGMALANPNVIKAVTEWFPPGQLGLAQGVTISGYNVGAGLAGSLSAGILLAAVGDWPDVYLVYGVVCVLVGVVWVATVRNPTAAERPDYSGAAGAPAAVAEGTAESTRETLRAVFGRRNTYVAVALAVCAFYAVIGGLGVIPSWLEAAPVPVPAWYAGIPLYAGIVGALTLPPLSDRVGRKPVLYLGLVGNALALVAGGFVATIPALVVVLVTAGVFGGGLFAMLYVLPGELPGIGPARAGTMAGALLALGQLGGTIAPVVGGRVLDTAGLRPSVLVVGLPPLLGVLAIRALELDPEKVTPITGPADDSAAVPETDD
ncbi:MFS transporter [Haloglomus salinum]|uniref:MFS transporter n=1 Tax=Haloglomus salinum TaxID=2962673 RepID=UPI0020C9409C|nr:MFS transporter [Haloglomus salinum]